MLQYDIKAEMVKAHGRLHGPLKERLAGNASEEMALAEYEAAPHLRGASLRAKLAKASATQDSGLVEAAQRPLSLVDQASSRIGNQRVTVKDSQGTIGGDNAIQVNHFGA